MKRSGSFTGNLRITETGRLYVVFLTGQQGAHLALHVVFLPHIQQFVYDTIGRFYKLISTPDQLVIRCLHLVTKRSSALVY